MRNKKRIFCVFIMMFVILPTHCQLIYDSPPVGVSLTRPILPWLARYFVGAGKANVFLDSPQPSQSISGAAVTAESTTSSSLPTTSTYSEGGSEKKWTEPKPPNRDLSTENEKDETTESPKVRKPVRKGQVQDNDDARTFRTNERETTTKVIRVQAVTTSTDHPTSRSTAKSSSKIKVLTAPKPRKKAKEEEGTGEGGPEENANEEAEAEPDEEPTREEAPKTDEDEEAKEDAKNGDEGTPEEKGEEGDPSESASTAPPVPPPPFFLYEGPGKLTSNAGQPAVNPGPPGAFPTPNYPYAPMSNFFPAGPPLQYMYPTYAISAPAPLPAQWLSAGVMPSASFPPMPEPQPVFDTPPMSPGMPPMPNPIPVASLFPTLITPEAPPAEESPIPGAPQPLAPPPTLPIGSPITSHQMSIPMSIPLVSTAAAAPGIMPAHAAIPPGSFVAPSGFASMSSPTVISPRYNYRNLATGGLQDSRPQQRVYLRAPPSHKPATKTKLF